MIVWPVMYLVAAALSLTGAVVTWILLLAATEN